MSVSLTQKQTSSSVRYLYSFLLYLAMPYLFLRMLWRSYGVGQRAYRLRLGERLGFYPFKLQKSIWVHSVSVGETIAAIPLIKRLLETYPDLPMVVTTMTPTGAARVNAAFGDRVIHAYLPYDFRDAVSRFFSAVNPTFGIIMETELWPNLLAVSRKREIPIYLMNARLSARSQKGYARIASLTREMLRGITMIAAHGEKDAERFIALGADKDKVIVTGNLKFDLELPGNLMQESAALRKKLGDERFIWVAASTHEGEEEMMLAAHRQVLAVNPDALLILVPRHPERFKAVAALIETKPFAMAKRSDLVFAKNASLYLCDTMGELLLMYAVADVAFIGGSLVARGGHNMIEAAALAKPIVIGPSYFNFSEMSDTLFHANGMQKITDEKTLAAFLIELMHDPAQRQQMGVRAADVVKANKGALDRQLALISIVGGLRRNKRI